ncbi:hypothetical protein ACUOFC_52680, partial [Escherichia sp. TWPC-MK]
NGGQFPYELRVSDYDGYNQFVVHRSPQPLMSPAWSPDGSKLAYVTFESGRSALVIQTLANGAVRQVASFPRHNGERQTGCNRHSQIRAVHTGTDRRWSEQR